ncbi:MAG: hypothetical protein ACRD1C_04090 [Terriglobales bacterium]
MTPPEWDRLQSLLDEWQPRPEPAAGFEARLHYHTARRTQRRERVWGQARAWWGAGAAALAAVVLAAFVYLGQIHPPAAARTAEQVAVVQDLQLWNKNADLIDHLDFLSLSNQSPATQDQD